MIRAYRLYTASDGNSHVVRGSLSVAKIIGSESILFKETPAHSRAAKHSRSILVRR